MKKILLIGSNFGSKVYLKILLKYYRNYQIYICSPNIHKKKINKKIIRCKSYEKAFSKNNFQFVICATTPIVQYQIIKFLKKKKIKLNGILLEKPISSELTETQRILKILFELKIPFLVNFVFTQLKSYKKLKVELNKKSISEVNYIWSFRQAFFKNKVPTWKANDKLGGGILKYYGIHVFYHLVDLFNLNEFTKFTIEEIKFNKKKNTFIKLKIFKNKIIINLYIDINSNNNLHKISLSSKKNNFLLINKSQDWTKNFKFFINYKLFNLKKESRVDLTKKTIDNLLLSKEIFENKKNKKYIYKVLIAHKLCEKIYKKTKDLIIRKKLNNNSSNDRETAK